MLFWTTLVLLFFFLFSQKTKKQKTDINDDENEENIDDNDPGIFLSGNSMFKLIGQCNWNIPDSFGSSFQSRKYLLHLCFLFSNISKLKIYTYEKEEESEVDRLVSAGFVFWEDNPLLTSFMKSIEILNIHSHVT